VMMLTLPVNRWAGRVFMVLFNPSKGHQRLTCGPWGPVFRSLGSIGICHARQVLTPHVRDSFDRAQRFPPLPLRN
jgi:hypothetical protein